MLLAYKARCMDFLSWIEQIGFGPGCLISSTSATQKWRKSHKDVVEKRVIAIKDFDTQWQRQSFLDSIIGSKTKNWVDVPAIDFTGETVKEIYLPFHPKWSPTPRAKKAEIVERAGEEDIKKFLDSFSFNSSPVITSANAEEFFKKFKFKGGKSCSFIKA